MNVGQFDRALRVVLGLIIVALPFLTEFALWQSLWAIGLAMLVGAVLIVTGLVRFCPAYWLFGTRTCEPQSRA